MTRTGLVFLLVSVVCVGGCQTTIPPDALRLSQESLEQRQSQTRQFDTLDEKKLLQAGAQVLQDLGFIRASLVTHQNEGQRTAARITFQRVVFNTQGQVSKIEGLDDPKLYQEFFDKLAQSVFLTAHSI
jgi:hypothetical protein